MKHRPNRWRSVSRLGLLLAAAVLLMARCGGGGGGTTSDSPSPVVETSADTVSDIVKLVQGAPQAPVLQDGAPMHSMAAPPCPPPAGATGNNTINSYYKPDNAFDGDINTWWVGAVGAGAWDLYYGFSSARQMDYFNITFYAATYAPTQIHLKVSTDGCNWTDKGVMPAGVKPEIAVGQSVKYLWIEMTGNPATNYPLIRDTDWREPVDNVYASGGPGANEAWYFPANAFDGDPNTWWVGEVGAGAWNLYYMFDTPRMVQMPALELFNMNYRPTSMELYTSSDGSNWTLAGEMEPGANPSQFVGAATQYVWIKMTGNPPSNFPLVKDLVWDIPVGASSGDSINTFYTPAKAFDSDLNTWWVGAQAQTEWDLIYNYATDTYIGAVDIAYYANTHAPSSTIMYTSNDGNFWTSYGVFPGGASTTLNVGATARYIRLHMSGAPVVGYPLVKDVTVSHAGVASAPVFVDVAAGYSHNCALLTEGTVKCWGSNNYGQLGNGTFTDSSTPVSVAGLSNVTNIVSGNYHTCAIVHPVPYNIAGSVYCWGINQQGSLGNGTGVNSPVPVQVSGITEPFIIFTSAGALHTCVIENFSVGGIKCWGPNSTGALGDGTTATTGLPVVVSVTPNGASAVATGMGYTCIKNDYNRGVECWGENAAGLLGTGNFTNPLLTSLEVPNMAGAGEMSGGAYFRCASKATAPGEVYCWGLNDKNQLGNPSAGAASATPLQVPGVFITHQLLSGADHTCTRPFTPGGVVCWGDNTWGQLGAGDTAAHTSPVVATTTITEVGGLAPGGQHTCVFTPNYRAGEVECWGRNDHGQLGNGTTTDSLTPVRVIGW